jgi:hypothetical protein
MNHYVRTASQRRRLPLILCEACFMAMSVADRRPYSLCLRTACGTTARDCERCNDITWVYSQEMNNA